MARPKGLSLETLRSRKRRGIPLTEQEEKRLLCANLRSARKRTNTRIDNMLKEDPETAEQALEFVNIRDKRKRKIDHNKAFLMKAQGKTASEIAAYFDVTENSIWRVLKNMKVRKNLEQDVKEFKDKRADVLALIQGMVLEHITTDDVKKASLRDKAIVFGTLFDKERLERDQSTSNNSLFFHIIDKACDDENEEE